MATQTYATSKLLQIQDVRQQHNLNRSLSQDSPRLTTGPVQRVELSPELVLEIQNWTAGLLTRFPELRDHPDCGAAMIGKHVTCSIKPRCKLGRPRDEETAHAIALHDGGVSWPEIPRKVLDPNRASQSHERLYLLRKAKAAVKRRHRQSQKAITNHKINL
jgi:hypothetical protein